MTETQTDRYEVVIYGMGTLCSTREEVDAVIAANIDDIGREGETDKVIDHATGETFYL